MATNHSDSNLTHPKLQESDSLLSRSHSHKPLSRRKSKRKSVHKPDRMRNRNHTFEAAIQKQCKLTEIWKLPLTSETKSENIVHGKDLVAKKMEENIEVKDKLIQKLKTQRESVQKKYSQLAHTKQINEKKMREVLIGSLLDLAGIKRKQQAQIVPSYGYFKDNAFVEGSFIRQLREQVKQKMKQIKVLQQDIGNSPIKQQKQSLKFKERFFQKELEQLTKLLKNRQKIILAYKQRLRFSEKQSLCHYNKLGWPLIADRYQPLELLGCGGFGQVYKCYDLRDNNYVALKESRFHPTGHRVEEHRAQFLKHVNREVKIQKSLCHPNIARLIDVLSVTESEVSFILEHCTGPQLSAYLKSQQCLEEKQARQIIHQILYALKYMYEQDNKIIHYDLKPSNIMFHQGKIKILDFGLCKQMESEDTKIGLTSQGVGTYWYLPPQTFRQYDNQVSSKVDIWSVGVIFFELLYGKRPFGHGISQNKIMQQGIILKALKVQFPQQTPLKYKVSEAAKRFIRSCLKYEQAQRLNPTEACDHEYFK